MNNSREAKQTSSKRTSLFIRSLNFACWRKCLWGQKQGSDGLRSKRTSRSNDNSIWSKRNLRHSRTDIFRTNDWRTIYFKGLSRPQEGIFVGTTLTLSICGAQLRIVLLYYYYSKWMSDNSNSQVVELDIFTKEGNYSYHNCTSKIPAGTSLSATVIIFLQV